MRSSPIAALLLTGSLLAVAAAAPPVRQQELRELSVEQAKKLVDDCRGKGYIYLNALESLSAGAAAELARHGQFLTIGTLRTLTPEAAEALAPFAGRLSLDGIEELSDEAAAALGRSKAQSLALPRLATVSARGQDALATMPGATNLPNLRALTSGPLAERLVAARQLPPGLVEISADAARVLARLPGDLRLDALETISAEAAGILADRPQGGLVLRGLRTLSPQVAQALVAARGALVLDGVQTVSEDVAKILAGRTGPLVLTGLHAVPHPDLLTRLVRTNGLHKVRSLPDDVIATIATIPGDRTLDGLTELSPTQAEMLGRHDGPLSLGGLTRLSDEAARGLLRHEGPLRLRAVTEFSPATLRLIMQHPQLGQKWLGDLRTLSPASARMIAAEGGPLLSFPALQTLSADVARELATFPGALQLDGLATLSTEAAAALAEFDGQWLALNGVKQLTPASAAALAEIDTPLQLRSWLGTTDRTTILTPEYASLLRTCVAHGHRLTLGNLRALDGPDDVAFAQILATMPGQLSLDDLTRLSPAAAAAFADFEGVLVLPRLKDLTPETAAALAKTRGRLVLGAWFATIDRQTLLRPEYASLVRRGQADSQQITLQTVTDLDGPDGIALARVLASLPGSLTLNRLTTLNAEAAAALAESTGQALVLPGLTSLAPEAARALAGYKGRRLFLAIRQLTPELIGILADCPAWQPATDTLASLTAETAGRLCRLPNWNGSLRGVTAIDTPDAVEIARILAGRRGPLYLPGLKRISPRTLLTLIEKEDVHLPLVEMLELIPEPDGSPTDDFVLPARFQDRQEQQRQLLDQQQELRGIRRR